MKILIPQTILSGNSNFDFSNQGISYIRVLSEDISEKELYLEQSNNTYPFIIQLKCDLNELDELAHLLFNTNYYFFRGYPVVFISIPEILIDSDKLKKIFLSHGYDNFYALLLTDNTSSRVYKLYESNNHLYSSAESRLYEDLLVSNRIIYIDSIDDLKTLHQFLKKSFSEITLQEHLLEQNMIDKLFLENHWVSLQLNNHKEYIQVIKNRYSSKFSIHFFINKNSRFVKLLSRLGPLKIAVKSVFNLIKKIFQ